MAMQKQEQKKKEKPKQPIVRAHHRDLTSLGV